MQIISWIISLELYDYEPTGKKEEFNNVRLTEDIYTHLDIVAKH